MNMTLDRAKIAFKGCRVQHLNSPFYDLLEEREVLLTNTLRNFLENGRSASGEESSEELRSSGLVSSASRQLTSPVPKDSSSHSVDSSLSSLRTEVHLYGEDLSISIVNL